MQTFTANDGSIITYQNGVATVQKSDKPASGSNYWCVVGAGEITSSTWLNDNFDNYRYNAGNYFLTEEEAQAKLNYDIACTTVRREIKKLNGDWKQDWNNEQQKKYSIIYIDRKKFTCDFHYYSPPMTELPSCKTEKIAEKIIKEYEKELCIIREYNF